MAYLLVTQPRHKCQLCSLARWSYQHSYANGKSHWLGLVSFLIPATAIRNMICQDSSTGCFEPCPLLHFYPILRGLTPLIPPSDPCEAGPKLSSWETSTNAGEAGCPPGTLFFPLEKLKFQISERPSRYSVVPALGRSVAVKVKSPLLPF